ncbi:MAG: uroporphyrinogen decarboxylase [Hyphomicrobiales bacterium]
MASKPLLDVLNGRKPERRPIWFMRQAGRYLPEYRDVRQKAGSFLDLCYNPELAAEVTLQPLRRFDLDAAIVFADILVVPHAMGVDLHFEENEGPVLEKIRGVERISRLVPVSGSRQVKAVCETLQRVKEALQPESGLIGFCGAPWTVASYMIEGGSSDRETARLAAYENPEWFSRLIALLIDQSVAYLSEQIKAGADVIQIFDSWAGDLPASLRKNWVDGPLADMTARLREIHPGVPVIVFARGAGAAQPIVAEATKAQAIGIESELAIDWLAERIPGNCAIQGNLDPVALLAKEPVSVSEAVKLAAALPTGRHIFNLGHGIRPQTEPGRLQAVIEAVRTHDREHGDG